MVEIDDAGIGSILGIPLVVGIKNGKIVSVPIKSLKGSSATEETFEILRQLQVDKTEEIHICRGKVFSAFVNEAKRCGYTNIIPMEMTGEIQNIAEDTFMESLYELGVSRDVVLSGKDYEKLFHDLINQLIIHPNLMQYVRPHFMMNPIYTHLVYKVSRLQNEFPNLYSEMTT